VTVAVNVTDSPYVDGFVLELIVVWVARLLTARVASLEVAEPQLFVTTTV
jgi:hypothetical protein